MKPVELSNRPRHLPRLDSVRGLAIVMVFAFHLLGTAYHGQDALEWRGMLRDVYGLTDKTFLLFYPATFGWAGVSLFFVLSGFVIHYSFLTSSRPFSAGSFYWRRFWRIYPPYLLALVVFAAMSFSRSFAFVRDFVLHLVLLHNLDRTTFFGINGAFWSIATEVQFYAAYPLLLWLRRRMGMSNVLFLTLFLSIASCAAIALHQPTVSAKPYTDRLVLPVVTWFDWALGAFVAERFYRGQRWVKHNGPVLAGLAVVCVSVTLLKQASVASFTMVSLFCAVLLERCVWSGNPLSRVERWLVRPGLCSYSFYLWHMPPLLLIGALAERFRIPPVPYILIVGPVVFAGTFFVSWALYVLVEQRSISLGKRVAELGQKYIFGVKPVASRFFEANPSPPLSADIPASPN